MSISDKGGFLPKSTVDFSDRLVACSGIPYTWLKPGNVRSKEMASGPRGFESTCDLNVSSHQPSGSPSCRTSHT